jgi:hypothetical protein
LPEEQKIDPNQVLYQVLSENKGLAKVHSPEDTVVMFASPARTKAAAKSNAAEGNDFGAGHLEYWPKDEEGTKGYPHPTGGGKTVLEIFDPELMKDPVALKQAIRGDLIHGMVNDPEFSKLRKDFTSSYTPETLQFEQTLGGKMNNSRHDAYIRGMLNPDKEDEFGKMHQKYGNLYSPKQIEALGKMQQYIKDGKLPKESDSKK